MTESDRPQPHVAVPLNGYWTEWSARAARNAAPGWAALVGEMAGLQDTFAAAAPPPEAVAEARSLVEQTRAVLARHEVGDDDQWFGRFLPAPDRGQTFSPPIRLTGITEHALAGKTMFGRFHSGNNSAAHGGGIALLFDDLFGRLVSVGDIPPARTASLSVNYRSVTPLDEPLAVEASVAEVDGRKLYLTGTLRHGDRLCADATALFLTLRPEQIRPAEAEAPPG
ncbi:PaaI family thioesterase [Actinomadura napierensis]|uniref:Acyl-coenzyme A thioesterase THEM4 n=1 Tax=Actinomadura napierensis TaxID=267854 RepID=A0ABP5LG66_9ACTN